MFPSRRKVKVSSGRHLTKTGELLTLTMISLALLVHVILRYFGSIKYDRGAQRLCYSVPRLRQRRCSQGGVNRIMIKTTDFYEHGIAICMHCVPNDR